jgi:hypothetical protein
MEIQVNSVATSLELVELRLVELTGEVEAGRKSAM